MTVQTVRKNTLPQLYLVNQNMSTCMKAFRFFSTEDYFVSSIGMFNTDSSAAILNYLSCFCILTIYLYILPYFAYWSGFENFSLSFSIF